MSALCLFVIRRLLCATFGHDETPWPEPGWIKCPRCGLIPGLENRPHRKWWQPT